MARRPWEDFAQARSTSAVHGARDVHPDELVDMAEYRNAANSNILSASLAYAQESFIHDGNGLMMFAYPEDYANLPREIKVNVFGKAYRDDARLWLHNSLADIVVDAAAILWREQGWHTVIYDGLRTVEGAFALYNFATDEDLAAGLLALPGQSAHNKGLAVDSMMLDCRDSREVDMGGHFDHLDMETNSRAYKGDKISDAAKKNRLIREAAFLKAAFARGLLIAPLRSEFWDDRLPENREDLWRVLDSAARCLGIELLSADDLNLRKTDRAAFAKKWEAWSYEDFLERWQQVFKGRQDELQHILGTAMPPLEEKFEFYHGNYHPIYDRDLIESGKNIT